MNQLSLIVHRRHNTVLFPRILPDAEFLATMFGFLVQRNETLTLLALADRIDATYNNPRTKNITQNLRVWVALAEFAADHVHHFDALPGEFEHQDTVYSFEDCLDILGETAIEHLTTRMAVAA